VPLAPGTHRVGPENGSLVVKTYREGMAAKVGHDLVLEVTRWEGTVEIASDAGGSAIELNADSGALVVREGLRGVKPLTDRDRDEIVGNIDKVLRGRPIRFRSSAVTPTEGDAHLVVEGDLTIAERTRPITTRLAVGPDGHIAGTLALTQSDWGIKPYRGLMGALKVRDEVEIVVGAHLPVS
jgi:polyisoprenoid-binding protein YceI